MNKEEYIFNISVIIPVYNMENDINRCIDSVIGQSIEDIEIICIDDGSTDKTGQILEEYQSKYSNIRIIHQKRNGAGKARNKGIDIARGEFIAFADADDYYASTDALEKLYKGAKKRGCKVAGGRMLKLRENTIIKSGTIVLDKMCFEEDKIIDFSDFQCCFGYQGFIFNMDMVRDNNLYFPDYIRGQDVNFMLNAMIVAKNFWTTSSEIYVYNNSEKRINFNSKSVLTDFAKSHRDVMYLAKKNGYEEILSDILKKVLALKYYFIFQIFYGNIELMNIIQEMDSACNKYKKYDNYFLDFTEKEVKEEVERYRAWEKNIISEIENTGTYLIYGAGRIGQSVYDVLKEEKNICFRGFAVTGEANDGRIRGEQVRSISEFADKQDTTVVIVASEEPNNYIMNKTAEFLGFNRRISVREDMIGSERFRLSEDRFAV